MVKISLNKCEQYILEISRRTEGLGRKILKCPPVSHVSLSHCNTKMHCCISSRLCRYLHHVMGEFFFKNKKISFQVFFEFYAISTIFSKNKNLWGGGGGGRRHILCIHLYDFTYYTCFTQDLITRCTIYEVQPKYVRGILV